MAQVGRKQTRQESDLKGLIRQVAAVKKMPMTDIAADWGRSPSTLSDRLTRGSITYEELKQICDILDVTMRITLTDEHTGTSWSR